MYDLYRHEKRIKSSSRANTLPYNASTYNTRENVLTRGRVPTASVIISRFRTLRIFVTRACNVYHLCFVFFFPFFSPGYSLLSPRSSRGCMLVHLTSIGP